MFTDLRMPGMNGAALRNEIAARQPRPGPRTVIITGDTVTGPIAIRAAAGSDEPLWMEKPFSREEVNAILLKAGQLTKNGDAIQ
jgi:CheY-like chemotaxis protein